MTSITSTLIIMRVIEMMTRKMTIMIMIIITLVKTIIMTIMVLMINACHDNIDNDNYYDYGDENHIFLYDI